MQASLGRVDIVKLRPQNKAVDTLPAPADNPWSRQASEKRKLGGPCKEVDPATTADLQQRQQEHQDKQYQTQQQQQQTQEQQEQRQQKLVALMFLSEDIYS